MVVLRAAVLFGLSVVACSLAQPSPNIEPNEYAQSAQYLFGAYILHWNINNTHIDLAVNSSGTGWFALGLRFASLAAMQGDVMYGYVANGVATVKDGYNNRGYGFAPTADATDNILPNSVAGIQSGGRTIVKWSRLLVSPDTSGEDVDFVGDATGQVKCMLAYHTSNNVEPLLQHTDYVGASIPFFSECNPVCGPLGTCNKGLGVCDCIVGASGQPCVCAPGFTGPDCKTPLLVAAIETVLGETTTSDDKVTLRWEIKEDNIVVEVEAATDGWVSFGLGSTMTGADIYVGGLDAFGSPSATDRKATAQAEPPLDTVDDILGSAVSFAGGKTKFTFVRKLDTGDVDQDVKIPKKKGTKSDVVLAYGESRPGPAADRQPIAKHVKTYQLKVDFAAGSSSDVVDLKVVHGILMGVSWALFTVVALFIARFFKSIGHKWFISHTALNSVAALATLIGFIIAVDMVEKDFAQDDGVAQAHGIIGLIVFILMMIQPFIGILADRLWSPDRDGTPIFPDIIHWWVGRISMFLAVIAMFLGIVAITPGEPGTRTAWIVVLAIWFLIVFIGYGVLSYRQWKNGDDGHGTKHEMQ